MLNRKRKMKNLLLGSFLATAVLNADIGYVSDIFCCVHKDEFCTVLQIPKCRFQAFASQINGDSLIVLCLNHK